MQQRSIDCIIFTGADDALSSSIMCFAAVGCCRVVVKISSLFKMVVVALTCLVVFSLLSSIDYCCVVVGHCYCWHCVVVCCCCCRLVVVFGDTGQSTFCVCAIHIPSLNT